MKLAEKAVQNVKYAKIHGAKWDQLDIEWIYRLILADINSESIVGCQFIKADVKLHEVPTLTHRLQEEGFSVDLQFCGEFVSHEVWKLKVSWK